MATHQLRTRNRKSRKPPPTNWARITLPCICLWPFLYIILFHSSSTPSTTYTDTDSSSSRLHKLKNKIHNVEQNIDHQLSAFADKELNKLNKLRSKVRHLLSRTGGYGPTHPRVAVVIPSATSLAHATATVESIYKYTPRARLLSVVVIFDGLPSNEEWVTSLTAIDEKPRLHFHLGKDDDATRSRKLHVIFNEERKGVPHCRQQGVAFASLLEQKMEQNGFKTAAEETLLLLITSATTLSDFEWLDAVTTALTPPPHPSPTQKTLANAVSLAVDFVDRTSSAAGTVIRSAPGSKPSFDLSFTPHWRIDPSVTNDVQPYPSPALAGFATGMRLSTYRSLPRVDLALTSQLAADVELAFNLWRCADGIDVLPRARVVVDPEMMDRRATVMSDRMVARLVTNWMGEEEDYVEEVLRWRAKREGGEVAGREEMARWAAEVMEEDGGGGVAGKCRSMEWFANEANEELKLKKRGPIKLTPKVPKKAATVKPKLKKNAPEKQPEETKYKHKVPEPHAPEKPHGGMKLNSEQLEILSHAEPVDISYVDLSEGHKDFPHKGAYDEDESSGLGYVHDAKSLKNHPPPFAFPNEEKKTQECKKRDNHYKMLTEKVFVDFEGHDAKNEELGEDERVKIFCIVYTIEANHDRLQPIRETWGPKCDGFMIASTKTDRNLNTVNIPHEGPEEYNNIWQKVRAIWSYVYDNYYNDYDFFHIGGDDLYLLVENLRLYLESDEIKLAAHGGKPDGVPPGSELPLFLGRRFAEQGNRQRMFNSGGSGYTINKAGLKALVQKFTTCFPHLKTFAEDVMVAACFRQMGVFPFETKDSDGGERYMPFAPGHHLTYQPPEKNPKKDWYVNYSPNGIKTGLDHCSARSVAFHYIKGDLMRRMHAILYKLCD